MSSAPRSSSQRPESSPPQAWTRLEQLTSRARRPLERFLSIEAASGVLLIAAAALALIWANSPWASAYARFWHTPIGFHFGNWAFERSLEWVVNDGLMVIFFFVVGLEIRREMHCGELSDVRRAALPAAAALGGMLVPAAFYLVLVRGGPARSGWGVPMATDIAFAVGILTLLGKRVPAALRVLLLALAVIDDLGAIVVIALFYSSGINALGFVLAGLGVLAIVAMQRVGVRSKALYILPSLLTWTGMQVAGIHPTIAGVLVGLLTPVTAWLGAAGFAAGVREKLTQLEQLPESMLSTRRLAGSLQQLDRARREVLSPAESLIETLHPWVAFAIMPVFALTNAGVAVTGGPSAPGAFGVATGVALGLFLGKPCGILLAIGIALRLGLGRLPRGLSLPHLVVLGLVGGVGFTMALFIAQLAFTEPALLASAKQGVLAGSALAALSALALGRMLLRPSVALDAAQTADEAEASTER